MLIQYSLNQQMKASKFTCFQVDCILSTSSDFIALSIFVHQYLFYRKGLEFVVVYICLLLINLTFLSTSQVIIRQIKNNNINSQHNLDDIMTDTNVPFDDWIRPREKPIAANYNFEMVIDEINSIYRN
jgi:hypothetical protein